ncbi:hypothetical protein [Methylobacterium sp. JK268]
MTATQHPSTLWRRAWDRLLTVEAALAATPEEIGDRRIGRIEGEVAALRREVAALRQAQTRGAAEARHPDQDSPAGNAAHTNGPGC